MDYQQIPFSDENVRKLSEQRVAHLLWRQAFFAGTKEKNIAPPAHSVLFEGQQSGLKQGAPGQRARKLPTEMTLDETGGAQVTFRKSSARTEKVTETGAAKKIRDEEMDMKEELQKSRKKQSSKKSSKSRKSKGAKNSSSKKKDRKASNKKK
jgi:hypothetical protein